jgi:hypothetical protein
LTLAEAPKDETARVSFRNDVMAVLSKAGCNAGTCHGNASGKGGFKLSLRGDYPEEDYLALTRDQSGRRINPLAPEQSLILLKPTTALAHEGGKRFPAGSWEYDTLLCWIAAGAPRDPEDSRRLQSIEVTPLRQVLYAPTNSVPLHVSAMFSDGSCRDVTARAVYEVAGNVVNVSADGRAERQADGEATVLVRYLNQQAAVRLAFVPERPGFTWPLTPQNNFIDRHVFAKLRTLRLTPSPLSSDGVFLRRAYLDLLGLLPSAEEARRFVADPSPGKRAELIDRLLQRPEFADFWALQWADLLRLEERALDQKGAQAFHHWIRQSIAEGKPLNQFAAEILAARGSTYATPAANFYRACRTPVTRAESAAQVFLGVRLQCAQCHNHPFDRWTQDDYYDWTALFAKLDYKVLENRRRDSNDKHEFKGEQIVFVSRQGSVTNPRTEQRAAPRFLGGQRPETREVEDDLEALARWVAAPDNPFFARMQVNRVWYHLLGRGIVDPIDDFRPTNPPSHPELLEELAADFVQHNFDLRHVIRVIMNSRIYQLSSEPNEINADDDLNYSHARVKRLSAEALFDGLHEVLGVPTAFEGYPHGTRAAQIPVPKLGRGRGGRSEDDMFMQSFGKPPRELTCECERSTDATMNQAFQMISGPAVNDLIARKDNRLGRLLDSGRPDRELVAELYWTALTRAPSQPELAAAVRQMEKSSDRRAGFEDVAWSLVNAKEFLLRQ